MLDLVCIVGLAQLLLRIETASQLVRLPSPEAIHIRADSTGTIKVHIFKSTDGRLFASCMQVVCRHTFMSHQGSVGSLGRGNGLVLTRTIRALIIRLMKMKLNGPLHNLKSGYF